MDLKVWIYRFGKESYIKQINDIWEWQKKNQRNSVVRQKKGCGCDWKESGFMSQRSREVEGGTLLLGNDKNNVIANKVLSYF